MANDLSAIIPSLIVQGLGALREQSIMPRLVNSSYSADAAEKGDTITVPISSAITATEVVPANIAPNPGDTQPTSVPIAMDQWYEAAFQLSDKDELEAMDDILPMQASEAIKAIANNVDQYILGLYPQFFGIAGDPTVIPFSDGTTKDATDARTVLNKQLAPMDNRWAVTDPDTEGSALNVRAFQDLSWNGSPQGIIDGQLNRKLGFGWWMDQNVPTHTAGSAAGYTADGVNAVGATTLNVTAGTGGFNAGDIITIAGDPQTYTVTETVAGPVTSAPISPALRVATAGGEAIAVTPSHVVNLFFHRDAIGLATRPLRADKEGIMSMSAVDPISGLSLRVEVKEEYKRRRYSYDILYGANVIRPELGGRLVGKPSV